MRSRRRHRSTSITMTRRIDLLQVILEKYDRAESPLLVAVAVGTGTDLESFPS